MAEYWYAKPVVEDRAKRYLDIRCEPVGKLEFTVGAKDFIHCGEASKKIKQYLKQLGADSRILRRIAIASYEAEVNIAAHSHGGKVRAFIYNDFIHVQYDDMGPGFSNIEEAMKPGWSMADEYVRGMGFGAGLGLPNIKKNCDVLHIVSGPNQPTLVEFIIYDSKAIEAWKLEDGDEAI